MKKLLLSTACAAMAFGAGAQSLYFMGDGQGLTWDQFPGKEVILGSDGYYTAEFSSLNSFKISTNRSSGWDGDGQFNAGAYQLASGSFGDAVYSTEGQTMALTMGSANNIDTPWDGAYTVKVKSDMSSITLITTTPKPTNAPDAYIVGAMTNWGIQAQYKMNVESAGTTYVYTIDTMIPAGSEFKIAGANGTAVNWGGAINYGTGNTISDFSGTPVTIPYNGSNMSVASSFEGTITLTIPQAPKQSGTISFASKNVEVVYPETMYVLGNVNGAGWEPSNGWLMNNEGDGIFTTIVHIGGEMGTEYGYFSFTTNLAADWDGLGMRYGALEGDTEPSFSEPNSIVGGQNSFKVHEGDYEMTLSLSDMTLEIEVSGEGPVTPPTPAGKDVYVVGAFNGWDPAAGLKLNHEEGTNFYSVTSSEAFADEWKLCDGTWDWNFGMGDTLEAGVDNECWFDGQNFSAIEGTVTLTFTLVSGSAFKDSGVPSIVYFTVENGGSGVEAIEAEGEAAYFNLQGVRVQNPDKGLYIRVAGGKAEKIVL